MVFRLLSQQGDREKMDFTQKASVHGLGKDKALQPKWLLVTQLTHLPLVPP